MLAPKARRFACGITFPVLAALTTGCMRTVQVWPLPLTSETPVVIRFATPRTIVFERAPSEDSLKRVSELRGRVLASRHDTLVIRVTRATAEAADPSRFLDWQTTIVVNRSTLVTRRELDSWKFAYLAVSSIVLLFAVAVLTAD